MKETGKFTNIRMTWANFMIFSKLGYNYFMAYKLIFPILLCDHSSGDAKL